MLMNLKTCNAEALKIGVTGDIHIGHMKTTIQDIIGSLTNAFPDTEETGDLDVIVFNGDVFDMGLPMYTDARGFIVIFIISFLKMCKKRDIVLYVLEGTPSHDNRQAKLFSELNHAIGAECYYIDELSIVKNEKLGSTFLFVPDEWRSTSDETKEEVKELLTVNKIDKVDFSFIHGYFAYQLPEIASTDAHDIDFYHDVTRYDIFINHIHTFSQRGRVTAPGSLDRLSHGEEEDKGHVRRSKDGVVFVINKGAKRYDTVDCRGLDLESAYKAIETRVKSIPSGSYIRPLIEKGSPLIGAMAAIKKEFPFINFSPSKIDGKKEAAPFISAIKMSAIEKIPTLTSTNIVSYLQPRLKERYPEEEEACLTLLKEIVNE